MRTYLPIGFSPGKYFLKKVWFTRRFRFVIVPAIGDCLSAQPARPRPLSLDSGTDGASVISCWRGASIPISALGKLRANCAKSGATV
jgi:hypothetical protein